MPPEDLRSVGNSENVTLPQIGGMIAERVEKYEWVWAFAGSEPWFEVNQDGELASTKVGKKRGICTETALFRKPMGWDVRLVEDSVGRKIVSAVAKEGGTICSLYGLDETQGRVIKISKGGSLGWNNELTGEIVLIPVEKTKDREGGILLMSARVLKKPQNVQRINGFLK